MYHLEIQATTKKIDVVTYFTVANTSVCECMSLNFFDCVSESDLGSLQTRLVKNNLKLHVILNSLIVRRNVYFMLLRRGKKFADSPAMIGERSFSHLLLFISVNLLLYTKN